MLGFKFSLTTGVVILLLTAPCAHARNDRWLTVNARSFNNAESAKYVIGGRLTIDTTEYVLQYISDHTGTSGLGGISYVWKLNSGAFEPLLKVGGGGWTLPGSGGAVIISGAGYRYAFGRFGIRFDADAVFMPLREFRIGEYFYLLGASYRL